MTVVCLFTRDLRISDNFMLKKAVRDNPDSTFILLFILNPMQLKSKNKRIIKLMYYFLSELQSQCNVNIVKGNQYKILKELAPQKIYLSRDYTPYSMHRYNKLKTISEVIEVENHKIFNNYSNSYVKFSAFYNKVKDLKPQCSRIYLPKKCIYLKHRIKELPGKYNYIGEPKYGEESMHISHLLKFGVKSVRHFYKTIKDVNIQRKLLWRDFYYGQAENDIIKLQKMDFKYYSGQKNFERWVTGSTDDILVNQLMHRFNETGWLSNRARMIVATYLIHELKVYWKFGEFYFMDNLIDYDPIINHGNWIFIRDLPAFKRIKTKTQAKKYGLPNS